MEEEPSYCTYGEAYEVNCARFGSETDLPIAHFKKRCCAPNGSLQTDPHCELRLQARAPRALLEQPRLTMARV